MALDDVREQKIVPDLGSEEVRLLRTQVNLLMDFVVDALNAVIAGGTFAAAQTALDALSTSDLRKVVGNRENPAQPAFPVTKP